MPRGEVKVRESRDPSLVAQRFWKRVDFPWYGRWEPRNPPELGKCWQWQGAVDRDGYGQFRYMGRQVKAHRVVLELLGYEVPSDRQVAHHCDRPRCVRPLHLFIATALENNRDKVAKGRQRHVNNLVYGEDHHSARLTPSLVRQIRMEYASEKPRQVDLASRFGISQKAISKIVRGESWKGVV